jgi:hypothetical protein
MTPKELREYINMVAEETEQGILNEMSNLNSDDHGIENVVIWIGKTNKRHGLRIKVSNIKNYWSEDDNFTIAIPSLDYDPTQVANWIKNKSIEKIKHWIKINSELLYKLDNGDYSSFRTFVNDTSKYTEKIYDNKHY